MKQFLTRLLMLFGLAPASRCRALEQQAQKAKADAQAWKGRAAMASARAQRTEDKAHTRTQRLEAKAERRARRRNKEVRQLQRRLQLAEQKLVEASNSLMAIDVKLDILEGAANVLDMRRRTAVAQQSDETEKPA